MNVKCYHCGGYGYFDVSDYLSQEDLNLGYYYAECPVCNGESYLSVSFWGFLAIQWKGWYWWYQRNKDALRYSCYKPFPAKKVPPSVSQAIRINENN